MSVNGVPEWGNDLGYGLNPLDSIEDRLDLTRFFGDIVNLQLDYVGSLPITVRHTAAFVFREEGVSTERHEADIYKMMQLLCTAGVIIPCVGPSTRVLDGDDRLPTYRIPDHVLLKYFEQNTY